MITDGWLAVVGRPFLDHGRVYGVGGGECTKLRPTANLVRASFGNGRSYVVFAGISD
jgi:hypothetical protein